MTDLDELHFDARVALPEAQERFRRSEAERDHYIRLFNRLEGAVAHWRKAGWKSPLLSLGALMAAHDRVLKDAAKGVGVAGRKAPREAFADSLDSLDDDEGSAAAVEACTCPFAVIDAMGDEGDLRDPNCPRHGTTPEGGAA